ncbi:MAG: hypothetical protein A2Y94_07120 [Caldithrix sp. RBG_13_44_9]|nr:MAG: hypothetical protein A2Y94_07120 [Caldithrix sp. RBG_13_44_9]
MMKTLRFSLLIILLGGLSIGGIWTVLLNESKPAKTSGAYEALNFFSAPRAYPRPTIPDISHYAAYEAAENNPNLNNEQWHLTRPWKSIGPHNTGGRTLALTFNPQNPNTIYAGSASGGLWRSKTAGSGAAAWEYVPTGFPVLSVTSIDIASNDSNLIYLGTGEVYNYQQAGMGAAFRSTRGSYGIGILKSIDGGISWSKSLDWSYNQMRGVMVVKINPLNSQTVWAGTTEGTYKSRDGGVTWNQVHNVIMVWDLVINPLDTNIVIIGCGNFSSTGHGIYRTSNSGQNWNKITQGLPATFAGKVHLAIYPPSPNIVFASIGNGFTSYNGYSWLCRSVDAGASWNVVSTQDYSQWQGWYSHDVGVSPADSNLVIAVGIGVWKSYDGGINLVQKAEGGLTLGRPPVGGSEGPANYVHADVHDISYHPTNPSIVYFSTDGGIFRSLDGGETFSACNGGYQTVQFYNGFSNSLQDSLLALGGLQDNATIIYDGQLAWTRVIGGDGACTGLNANNDNILYASWQNLNLLKSTNRGQSWFNLYVPSSSPTSFIAPFVVARDNPQVMYAGRAIIYKSINSGSSWTVTNNGSALDGNPAIAMAISQQNSNIVYAATAPSSQPRGIFRTLDGGAGWTNISGNLPDRYPADLAVDPTNDAVVYVSFSGFGTPHLFRSTDFGNSWQDISTGLPNVPTSAVVVDPLFPDQLYAGNDLGIYVSNDAGMNWYNYQEGLPEAVMVFDLVISAINRKLRLATHGNGAYERDLIGGVSHIDQKQTAVTSFALRQNYPNPFNPFTTIAYSLPQEAPVTLVIYNTLGQEIRTLVNHTIQYAGDYEMIWDGLNDAGNKVASGTYIYQLRAGEYSVSKMMSLTR